VDDDLLELGLGQTVVLGPREVAPELFGTAVRDECRNRDQAAVTLGQLRAFPDIAKQNVISERDQLWCEVADRFLRWGS
jgi:hypothetical protein